MDIESQTDRQRILTFPKAEETPIHLRLVLQPGGMVIELGSAEVLIGRHSQADVRLPLPEVSRRHCRFRFARGRWEVIDLNSLNGTYVNEERVDHTVLHQGDIVRIGGFLFGVEIGEPFASEDASLIRHIFKDRPATSEMFPDSPRQAS